MQGGGFTPKANIRGEDYHCDLPSYVIPRGVDPYGTGGHVPQYLDWGDIITNVPLNISRVISAAFYPCNIFLIS